MNESTKVRTKDLDRLRAGLLDDRPAERKRVREALEGDARLAVEDKRWCWVYEQLERSKRNDIGLHNQLRLRRRRVLSGQIAKRRRLFTLPQMAFAAAASVALTLSLVFWMDQGLEGTQAPGLAAAGPAAQVHAIDFDLTKNVDFYVWLKDQESVFIEAARKGT